MVRGSDFAADLSLKTPEECASYLATLFNKLAAELSTPLDGDERCQFSATSTTFASTFVGEDANEEGGDDGEGGEASSINRDSIQGQEEGQLQAVRRPPVPLIGCGEQGYQ